MEEILYVLIAVYKKLQKPNIKKVLGALIAADRDLSKDAKINLEGRINELEALKGIVDKKDILFQFTLPAPSLSEVYPVLFVHAIHYYVPDVDNECQQTAYVITGLNDDIREDFLKIGIRNKDNSIEMWPYVMNSLRVRDVECVLVDCTEDELSEIRGTIQQIFPKAMVHTIQNGVGAAVGKLLKAMSTGHEKCEIIEKHNDMMKFLGKSLIKFNRRKNVFISTQMFLETLYDAIIWTVKEWKKPVGLPSEFSDFL